jgi:hypothetical protein
MAGSSPRREATNELRRRIPRIVSERRAGGLLRLLRDSNGYRSLGFACLAEYVTERLGVGVRTAQEMMRVDAALESLPLMAAAAESGEIGSGHFRLLTRVARQDTEAFWLSIARGTTARELTRLVTAASDRVAVGCRTEDDLADGPGSPANGAVGDPTSLPDSGGSNADTWLGGLRGGQPDSPDGDPQPEPRQERLSITAPAWVVTLWRDTLPIVRRLAGSDLAPGACLEIALAELSSDVGTPQETSVYYPDDIPSTLTVPPAASNDTIATHATPESPACLIAAQESTTTSSGPATAVDGRTERNVRSQSDDDATYRATARPSVPAEEADAELKHLLRDYQRRQADLAEHFRLVALDRGYRDEGFSSLEEYALDRFGLPPRTFYRLLALDRAFRYVPALRREFLSARLTGRQAVLLGSVATSLTVEMWVQRARSVTLRRLEDEINFWTHLKKTRPDVWALLDGGPLPEGIDLAPGQPPRLPMSALRNAEPGREPGGPSSARPAPTSGRPGISAAAFLRALEIDEAATPLPHRMGEIRLLVEPHVSEMWRETVRKMRSAVRESLEEWEALALVLREFLLVWDNSETRRQRRENPTLERDGWRCTAPGCRSTGTGRLQEHHVIFRSHGGPESDPRNLTTLCNAHHAMLHDGLIRCSGEAPGGLTWELGVQEGREPFLVYFGETRIGGSAP